MTFQIPRYIITLHELLAHTPPDHVEKNSLEQARVQLEDLSRQMHDEVSETENIRKNLAIERMIVEVIMIRTDFLLNVERREFSVTQLFIFFHNLSQNGIIICSSFNKKFSFLTLKINPT